MPTDTPVTLRYFDCRGRAQGLRYLLVDAGVEFTDDRVPFDDTWSRRKHELEFGGPFGALPVLRWGETIVAQTEAVALFLARALELAGDGGDYELSMTVALSAFAHQDLLQPALGVLWQAPGADLETVRGARAAARDRLRPRLEKLECWLTSRGPLLLGARPCAGDYLVLEALEAIITLVGAELLDDAPRVRAQREALRARPRLSAYLRAGARPGRFSGSPAEPEILEQLATLTDPAPEASA